MGRRRHEPRSSDGTSNPPEVSTETIINPDNNNAAALAALDEAASGGESYPEAEDQGDDQAEEPAEEPSTRRRLATPAKTPRSLHPMFLSLARLLESDDPSAIRDLSKLDYGRTSIVLEKRGDDLGVISASPPIPLNRFAPDFLRTILLSKPSPRMTVQVFEKDEQGRDFEPWSFALVLPPELLKDFAETVTAQAATGRAALTPVSTPPQTVAATMAPPPAGVDAGMFMMVQMMQQQAAQQTQMFQQMMQQAREDAARREADTRAMMERLQAGPAADSRLAKRMAYLDAAEDTWWAQQQLMMRGERTGIKEQIKDYVSTLKDLSGVKDDLGDLFGEEQPPDVFDKFAGFAQSPVGQHLINAVLPKGAAPASAPALNGPEADDLDTFGEVG